MKEDLAILIVEALAVYGLVLFAHSLRRRFGLAHFYALIGGLTAVMSWITDANVKVQIGGVSFMVGSTVFYTALLLAVFVVYVFDGPRATRIAISTIAGISIMAPLIALVLHFQMRLSGTGEIAYVPIPSFRINAASVLTAVADLVFLAVAWELLGKPRFGMPLWLRAFMTLLGVMWLDVLLFSTGAFAGSGEWFEIMSGTLVSRFFICLFAFPFLYAYLQWQNRKVGVVIEHRPVFAILREMAEVRFELSRAQQEIERRKQVEREKETLIAELRAAFSEVKILRGFLPMCANCKKIRDDAGYWRQVEDYIQSHSDATFSHGLCPGCFEDLYPEMAREKREREGGTPPAAED